MMYFYLVAVFLISGPTYLLKCKDYAAYDSLYYFKNEISSKNGYIDGFVLKVPVSKDRYSMGCCKDSQFNEYRIYWYPDKTDMLILPPPYWENK